MNYTIKLADIEKLPVMLDTYSAECKAAREARVRGITGGVTDVVALVLKTIAATDIPVMAGSKTFYLAGCNYDDDKPHSFSVFTYMCRQIDVNHRLPDHRVDTWLTLAPELADSMSDLGVDLNYFYDVMSELLDALPTAIKQAYPEGNVACEFVAETVQDDVTIPEHFKITVAIPKRYMADVKAAMTHLGQKPAKQPAAKRRTKRRTK